VTPADRRAAGARPGRLAVGAAFAVAILARCALAQDAAAPPPDIAMPAPSVPGNLTREEKRCNAALRRVERHEEKLAETKRALEANREATSNCSEPRACGRAAHRRNTLAARERNEERQLARLETEARSLCDASAAAASRRSSPQ